MQTRYRGYAKPDGTAAAILLKSAEFGLSAYKDVLFCQRLRGLAAEATTINHG